MSSPLRAELAYRLGVLYSDAGSPPLKAVSARATRELRARNPRGREVSAQRISDWRGGRSVPAKFDGLAAVLSVLVPAAGRNRPEPTLPGLYSMPAWRKLWSRAQQERACAEPAGPAVCPYPGLAALTIDDAECFAGRDSQTETMLARFNSGLGSGELLVLVGDSGVGKSSMLQAGFAARLSDDIDVLLVTPAAVEADEIASWTHDRASESRPFVLAVDQLEELFLAPFDDDYAERYLAVVAGMTSVGPVEPGRCAGVVVALRADFYTQAARHPALATALESNQMLLGPPTAAELTAAIVEPAKKMGLTVGDGLVELMLADLGVRSTGTRGVIPAGTFPLLAHALRSTWQARDGNVLSVGAYEQAGGVRGAIATSAERQWESFGPQERDIARTVLLELVIPVPDGSAVGRHVDRDALVRRCPDRASADAVLNALAEARIITQDAHGTSLAHDAVIGAWPRLAVWVEDDREDAITRHRIQTDVEEWTASGRDRALLYQGTRLAVASDLRARTPGALSPLGVEFIAAGEEVRRRQSTVKRVLVLVLVLAAVATSVLAVVSMRQSQRAERARADAEHAALISAARYDQSVNPTESARLALAAESERPDDPQARGLVLASQSAPLAATVPAHRGAVYGTAQSSSGQSSTGLVASGGYDNTVRLWRRDDAAGLVPLGVPLDTESWVASVAFSPDGNTLFATGGSGRVQRWDVSDANHPVRGPDIELGGRGAVYSLATRADGRWIATAGDDHLVRLHDLVTGMTRVLTGHDGAVRTVAFSPDGNTLVSGSDDRTARVWDVADPNAARQLGAPLTGQSLTVHSAAFSPDGATLATGSDDQTFRLWSMRDRDNVVALGPAIDAHAAALWSLSFASDGKTLATAAWDGAVKLWNVADPRTPVQLGQRMTGSRGGLTTVSFLDDHRVLTGGQAGNLQVWSLSPAVVTSHTRRVQAPSFDASGDLMATGSWDGQVLLWRTGGPAPEPVSSVTPLADDLRVENVALAPDGRTLAVTFLESGDVQLFDTTVPAAPRFLTSVVIPGSRYAHEIVFSPDSRLLATAADDSSVQLWDLADRAHPVARPEPLTGPAGWVNAVAFSPDGSRLYAAAADRRLHRWDLTGGSPTSAVVAEQGGPVNSLSISADGTLLAAGGDDQIVRIMRISGDDVEEVSELHGHSSTVRSVSFDPTSRLLATGADDQTVRLWALDDPSAPSALGETLVPLGVVRWRVAFSPTGALGGGGENGVLGWWTTDVDAAADRVCVASHGTELEGDLAQWSDEAAAGCAT
ncbi:hypothetical protein OG921_20300 [Aldersonia sp. NBC_00410]|uniref:nSTAND1 domain-containing NTPase n=1 Tax=Aldersonia sp. NBC_00410 TaxID=2975954 RepID=UPI0022579D72|nr:hypothetical protein [Aldersonia sp. NBC_00410]MCX5045511.1 hypothetical protein [Aldersonia sp. NBC_00410]